MTEPSDLVGEVAVEWVVRMHSDQRTRADEDAFRRWLEEDLAHADAYADCVALWDGVALAADREEATALLRPLRASRTAPKFLNRRAALWSGAAAAVAALAAIVVPVALQMDQVIRTRPGEQKRVRLADGSRVLLNTDSLLRVRFSDGERRLILDRGQVFFQVAKDKTRPFRVFVGRDEVRALGTAFEVRRMGDIALVTLEEGSVAVYSAGHIETLDRLDPANVEQRLASAVSTTPAAVLLPGQQAELASGRLAEVRHVDLSKVQAWRYGRMILDDARLGDTIADLNRYGGVQIVLADPKLADIRVSGVFHTGRPEDFVQSLTAAFPVQIARQDDTTIVLQSR